MERHGVIGPPGQFSHIYSYQTADRICVAIQLRPPYDTGRLGTQIHKVTSDWDSRKGVDDLTPHDMMIRFSDRSIEVCQRARSSAWHHIRGLHGATFQQLDKERCYWTMTKHGSRYWLISIELAKRTSGKLWPRLMKDEIESNRPSMKWDKDMQKTPMIADKSGKFFPTTFCLPDRKPPYETLGDDALDDVLVEEIEDGKVIGGEEEEKIFLADLVQHGFGIQESTHSISLSVALASAKWRELQRRKPSCVNDAFWIDIPFGGNSIDFVLRGAEENPILRGKLGGCVWRCGCRWFVEQTHGQTMLQLYMPKQTPEPWSFIVEGYEQLNRSATDPYSQRIIDGLWEDEAIQEKTKGDDYFRHSEYRAAVQCYSRALERNPDSYVTLTNRAAARLAYETEKFKVEAVLEDARRAFEINPQWHKAKFREGIVLCKLHRYDEAIWALEEAQRMDKTGHEGWEEEIRIVKEKRIEWANRKPPSYLNDIE
eukprot:TRINITY_DN21795_c0_g1_i1.p1 TRINITY_DN21795_c0_g1~~TRINITY_DN21795_c0_g1_i1.p1  ORF type:complete len:484 (+),score=88.59 TRINITY_DN21795_c0_g1_i1:64-1515(+)